MRDSNYTLKFHRTAREAFGHDLRFENERASIFNAAVLAASMFALGLLVGFLLGT
jgi:hypothetical protein